MAWKLYTASELHDIESRLKSGERSFYIGNNKCIFDDSKGYMIQRIHNRLLGLAYVPEAKSFAFNYPHISNVRQEDLASIGEAFTQVKLNGTNLAWVKIGDSVVHRTRGTLSPERVINDVNTAILQGKTSIVGVKVEVFEKFRATYEPMLREGIDRGYVDSYGNLLLKPIVTDIWPQIADVLLNYKSVVALFGELISPFNPICVSPSMDVGMYLKLGSPYQYCIFDVLSVDDAGGVSFWASDMLSQLPIHTLRVSPLNSQPLVAHATTIRGSLHNLGEEGVVVKSPSGYYKFKRDDVLEWERMVSRLTNVVEYSIKHVFETEYSFSESDVLGGRLNSPKIFDEMRASAWQEIASNGVSEQQLVDFYATKGKTPEQAKKIIERVMNDSITQKTILLVAPVLKERGVQKEEIWRQIPTLVFLERPAIYFDEKRGKDRPYEWYGRMVSWIIGKTYFPPGRSGDG